MAVSDHPGRRDGSIPNRRHHSNVRRVPGTARMPGWPSTG